MCFKTKEWTRFHFLLFNKRCHFYVKLYICLVGGSSSFTSCWHLTFNTADTVSFSSLSTLWSSSARIIIEGRTVLSQWHRVFIRFIFLSLAFILWKRGEHLGSMLILLCHDCLLTIKWSIHCFDLLIDRRLVFAICLFIWYVIHASITIHSKYHHPRYQHCIIAWSPVKYYTIMDL